LCIAISFVEPTDGRCSMVVARRPSLARAFAIASTSPDTRSGRTCSGPAYSRRAWGTALAVPSAPSWSDRFDLKADVDRGRGMRDGADGHEFGAGGRKLGYALERNAAGNFDFRAAPRPPDRFRDVRRGHVVDQDDVRARGQRVVHLLQPLGLDLDR